ncbi:methyltransferase domain-containing protein [Candidatus Electrothrix sp.]|uniref:methyltransferase domain-containing protein n=1 Tax=Candidatus Electrothrix sp. TaxID=2170559 RepID=UPI00405736E7
MSSEYSDVVEQSRDYYNSADADEFYYNIWGGEDIHIGMYEKTEDDIRTASRRTVAHLAACVTEHPRNGSIKKVLDIGSGYGGAARYLAKQYGWNISCLNLSEAENERNRKKNKEAGLDDLIEVVDGSFESLPFDDSSFDLVWCQDAILHSGDKARVFEEVHRVLRPDGELIFTDPMQSDNCPEGVLDPILARIHLDHLGSFALYKELAEEKGFRVLNVEEHTEQLSTHYAHVADETRRNYSVISQYSNPDYLDRMLTGLEHWVSGGKKGYLAWGILHFQKKTS